MDWPPPRSGLILYIIIVVFDNELFAAGFDIGRTDLARWYRTLGAAAAAANGGGGFV